MNTYQLQQCLLENIFCIPSTRLLTQSRSLGRLLLFAGAQASLADGTATAAHSWAHLTHTHHAFYSLGSKLCPKPLVFFTAWRTKASAPQGLICCQWKGWQKLLQVQYSGDADLHPSWRAEGKAAVRNAFPALPSTDNNKTILWVQLGLPVFPTMSVKCTIKVKKHKLLALDTFHSMAGQFRDTLKKINK